VFSVKNSGSKGKTMVGWKTISKNQGFSKIEVTEDEEDGRRALVARRNTGYRLKLMIDG